MKFTRNLLYISFSLVITACATTKNQPATNEPNSQKQVREYSVQSVMWQQNAAEYRALCFQAYNAAKYSLDNMLSSGEYDGKKLAIITDIDETVLDNSPYNAMLIKENKEYQFETWKEWTSLVQAKAIPGAVDFFNYAKSKGVEIFYVSNRMEEEMSATIKNLSLHKLPFADINHVYLRIDEGSKQKRFDLVNEKFTVLLYIGDNLADFDPIFRKPSTDFRNKHAKEYKDNFGTKFIALPNPMYGDWESKGIYEGKHNWTEPQKDSIRKENIHSYK